MAQLTLRTYTWTGQPPLTAGSESSWLLWHSGLGPAVVVNATAQPYIAREYVTQRLTTHVEAVLDSYGSRGAIVRVRNTGSNYVRAYQLTVCYITP